jgi:hypothetical protein
MNAGKIEGFGMVNQAMKAQGLPAVFPEEALNYAAAEKDKNKQAGHVAVLEFLGQNALQIYRNQALAQQQAAVQSQSQQQAHGYRMVERAASAPAPKPMFGVRVGEGVNFGAGAQGGGR